MDTLLYFVAGIFIYVFGPITCAIAVAGLWRGIDEILVRIGLRQRENLKFFGLYVFRGLLVTLAIIAGFTFISRANRGDGDDPFAKDSWDVYQQQLRGDEVEQSPAQPQQSGVADIRQGLNHHRLRRHEASATKGLSEGTATPDVSE